MENNKQMLVEELFKLYSTELTKYAYIKTKCIFLTEELIQNLFLKICSLECVPSPKNSSTKAYLYKALNNLLIDYIRRNAKKESEVSLEEISGMHFSTLSIEDAFIEKEFKSYLHNSLANLNKEDLTALIEKALLNRKNKARNSSYYYRRKKANSIVASIIKEKLIDYFDE